jgi:hypothetical protein
MVHLSGSLSENVVHWKLAMNMGHLWLNTRQGNKRHSNRRMRRKGVGRCKFFTLLKVCLTQANKNERDGKVKK